MKHKARMTRRKRIIMFIWASFIFTYFVAFAILLAGFIETKRAARKQLPTNTEIQGPSVQAPMPFLPEIELVTQLAEAPKTAVDMDDYSQNYDLILGTILAEARGEGVEGMQAVAQVIYDRTYCFPELFGDGLYSVLTAPRQFAAPFYCAEDNTVTEAAEEAMEMVFINGQRVWDHPVVYFYNPATASSCGAEFLRTKQYVETIGNHEFRTEWSVDINAEHK